MPMFRFAGSRSLITLSSKANVPPSILLKPAIIRSNVVFPQPDGPSSVKNSPSRIVKDRSGIMVLLPYRLTASLMLILTLMLSLQSNCFFLYICAPKQKRVNTQSALHVYAHRKPAAPQHAERFSRRVWSLGILHSLFYITYARIRQYYGPN